LSPPAGFATGLKKQFQLVSRRADWSEGNPPLARETKVGYGVASNPPHAPTPATHRDLPVGREFVRSALLVSSSQAVSAAKWLAPKKKLHSRFQSDDPCPVLSRKIFRLAIS
jgi:hypothetical protein